MRDLSEEACAVCDGLRKRKDKIATVLHQPAVLSRIIIEYAVISDSVVYVLDKLFTSTGGNIVMYYAKKDKVAVTRLEYPVNYSDCIVMKNSRFSDLYNLYCGNEKDPHFSGVVKSSYCGEVMLGKSVNEWLTIFRTWVHAEADKLK